MKKKKKEGTPAWGGGLQKRLEIVFLPHLIKHGRKKPS